MKKLIVIASCFLLSSCVAQAQTVEYCPATMIYNNGSWNNPQMYLSTYNGNGWPKPVNGTYEFFRANSEGYEADCMYTISSIQEGFNFKAGFVKPATSVKPNKWETGEYISDCISQDSQECPFFLSGSFVK